MGQYKMLEIKFWAKNFKPLLAIGVLFCLTLCFVVRLDGRLFVQTAHAEAQEDDDSKNPGPTGASGLPLPRFASLRTNETNLRTGPGKRYPIDWVYKKQGLPLEITAEYDVWRRVRDVDGTEGWVHRAALTGKRMVISTEKLGKLYKFDSEDSAIVANIEGGAIGQLLSCGVEWCIVKFTEPNAGEVKGYLKKTSFWGAYQQEVF